jgi:multisubunit Na+/H+ antiporter MnhB subunit
MSQHDMNLENQAGAAFRADLNNALGALVTLSSGATAPTPTFAFQFWADTSTGILKIRNSANTAWVDVGTLSATGLGLLARSGGTMTGVLAAVLGTAAAPGVTFSGDPDTGLFSPGANQVALSAGGVEVLRGTSSGVQVSGTGAVRVPSGTEAQRPASPVASMFRFNSTTQKFEGYNGVGWGAVGGGATGAVGNEVFYENDQSVTADYTITTGRNAMSAGPVTIDSGVTVTVPNGSEWTIV